jgi:hypothetical protein
MTTRMSIVLLPVLALAAGCGSSIPPPNERLSSSEGAVRGAQEVGAPSVPRAALHLKLAQEQVDRAKALMQDGRNQDADLVLMRAQVDAELAIALARESSTRREAQQLSDKVKLYRDSGKK